MSLLVSEKKIVSSWAEKSIPTKYEGLPVTGMITSSWVERLNGIPRTAVCDENSRNCRTAVKGKITYRLYWFTREDTWALKTPLFYFDNTNSLKVEKEEWENRDLNTDIFKWLKLRKKTKTLSKILGNVVKYSFFIVTVVLIHLKSKHYAYESRHHLKYSSLCNNLLKNKSQALSSHHKTRQYLG